MDLEELRNLQAMFMSNSELYDKHLKKHSDLEDLRYEFIKKYNRENILDLSLEEYVIGKNSKDSFCYWIERKLEELGNIKGSTAIKFGVYYRKSENDYRFAKKWGETLLEAFENIKHAICDLIIAGERDDLEKIIENKVSPMFKGKILAMYHPEKFINIFSKKHVNHLIEKLPLEYPAGMNLPLEKKKRKLLDFKNQDEVMKDWNNYIFMVFVYNMLNLFGNKDRLPEVLNDYSDQKLPDLDNVKVENINLNIGEIEEKDSRNFIKGEYKPDYDERHKINTQLGERGEKIVLGVEKEYLNAIEREDLAEKVEMVSLYDDSKGFDILSFDKDGNKKYIEVKSTRSKPNKINFILTRNELNKAKKLDNYYIYIVFEVDKSNPKIQKIKDPLEKNINIEPIKYKVTIGIKN